MILYDVTVIVALSNDIIIVGVKKDHGSIKAIGLTAIKIASSYP